jgi:hypothetical protein
MKKIIITSLLFLFSFGFISAADAPSYPVAELENCANKAECATYCNKTENMEACISYGEKNKLMSVEEIKTSKLVASKIKEGKMPGNCKDKVTCESFCQGNITNLEACLSFADEVGITGVNIEEGKKIAKALKEGASLPGSCKTKTECETYCSDPINIEECLNFGEKSGIIDAKEITEAKKVMKYIKLGETPGGCKRKADCDTYCKVEANFNECVAFAEKAGFLSGAELEMVKNSGGKGPGGCQGKEACETYCNDQSHYNECVEFGIKTGAITGKDAEMAKGGIESLKSGLEKIPEGAKSDAESCLNQVFDGKLQDVLNGKGMITKVQGEKIGPCIESAINKYIETQKQQNPQGGPESMPGSNQGPPANIPTGPSRVQGPPANIPTGPSGTQGPPCSSPEECMKMFGPK